MPMLRGGQANETDNVDDSPEQWARVDNRGFSTACCVSQRSATSDSGMRGTEDRTESIAGDDKNACVSTQNGRNSFRLKISLTSFARPLTDRDKCQLHITPTNNLGLPIESYMPELDPQLRLPEGQYYVSVPSFHPIPGGSFTVPNNSRDILVGLEVESQGNFDVTSLIERDSATGEGLNSTDCGLGDCVLALSQPVAQGESVSFDANFNQMDPDQPRTRLLVRSLTGKLPFVLADLSIALGDAPIAANTGEEITQTFQVTNRGSIAATDARVVAESEGDGFSISSAEASQGTCKGSASIMDCGLGDIAPGAEASVTLHGRATKEGFAATHVTVRSNETDPNHRDNTVSTVTDVIAFEDPKSDEKVSQIQDASFGDTVGTASSTSKTDDVRDITLFPKDETVTQASTEPAED